MLPESVRERVVEERKRASRQNHKARVVCLLGKD